MNLIAMNELRPGSVRIDETAVKMTGQSLADFGFQKGRARRGTVLQPLLYLV